MGSIEAEEGLYLHETYHRKTAATLLPGDQNCQVRYQLKLKRFWDSHNIALSDIKALGQIKH